MALSYMVRGSWSTESCTIAANIEPLFGKVSTTTEAPNCYLQVCSTTCNLCTDSTVRYIHVGYLLPR